MSARPALPLDARLLLLGAALSLLVGLGAAPLFDLDEGAFTAATLEMFARGDFMQTFLNGQPRTDKPILIYWLQAASVAVFGWSEWALRLPSAVASLAWMAMAYAFARRLYDTPTALAASVLTATTLGVALISHAATADALLNACLAGAVFAQYLALRDGDRRLGLLAWACMGLGFLTKGPVALLLPLGTAFLYCASRGAWARFFGHALNLRGIGLFLLIAAPWYVAVTLMHGTTFVEGFFLKHNVARYAGAMEGHAGGPLYYLPVLLLLALPFTGLLGRAAGDARALWRDDFARYALLLLALTLALFSFSATKLPHYLLYGCSALWVLLGRQLAARAPGRAMWLAPVLLAALLLAFPDLIAALLPRAQAHYQLMLADLDTWFGAGYRLGWAAILLLALAMLALRAGRRALLAMGIALSLGYSLLLLPAVGGALQGPVREAGRVAAGVDAPLVMHGLNMPSFSVYAGRVVQRRVPEPGDVALTRVDHLADLPAHDLLYREKGIALVRVREATP